MSHTSATHPAWALLRCPSCQGGLQNIAPPQGANLICDECLAEYPILAGIPLLLSEPQKWLERWQAGVGQFAEQMAFSERQLLVELFDQELSERSQNRLKQIVNGLRQRREEVLSLMAHAGILPVHPSVERPNRQSDDFSLEAYSTLIHRDYGWAPEVNEAQLGWERLRKVLPPDFRLGRTLLLGAGTGRLAWQMAVELGEGSPVLALDINPLPFLVTGLLLAGREVLLTELPAHPRKSNAAAVQRRLTCPLPAAPQLALLFADGLKPPVEPGTFDTVVTPWFVDQVPEDAAVVPELVNDLLCDGGSYICTGPFVYEAAHTRPALRYCADEYIEAVGRSGFVVTSASYETESYAASPLSTQGRTEHVLYMHARKVAAGAKGRRSRLPSFLKPGAGATDPVSRPEGLDGVEFSTPAVAEVATLINGQRTVLQIAELLIERGSLADDGTADAAVRGCLKAIFKQMKLI